METEYFSIIAPLIINIVLFLIIINLDKKKGNEENITDIRRYDNAIFRLKKLIKIVSIVLLINIIYFLVF